MNEKTIKAFSEAREYFYKMWSEGRVTREMLNYRDKVEEVFETLGIDPD